MDLTKLEIRRLIIHKIIGKKGKVNAYCITADNLQKLEDETEETLKSRVINAVVRSKRFFETKVDDTSESSFWYLGKELIGASKEDFIDLTKKIAVVAENAHQKATIPGGLLIIIDCKVDGFDSIIIVKAELQEALTLRGNAVELIKELFLSPAKEFYKIGLLIHKNKRSKQVTSFDSYVYDDNFNPGKKDIAEYFYKDFLGFSTSENDKLKTNNFLKDFVSFVDKNVQDFESRKNLKIRIKADYRESSNNIIDPSSYKEFFQFDPILETEFNDEILNKYDHSFSKNLELVDPSLRKSSLTISAGLNIVGDSKIVDEYIDIINPNNENGYQRLTTEIESGKVEKVVIINNLPRRANSG